MSLWLETLNDFVSSWPRHVLGRSRPSHLEVLLKVPMQAPALKSACWVSRRYRVTHGPQQAAQIRAEYINIVYWKTCFERLGKGGWEEPIGMGRGVGKDQ